MIKNENISDTEIRVIGMDKPKREPDKKRKWLMIAFAIIALAIVVLAVVLAVVRSRNQAAITASEQSVYEPIVIREQPHPLREWLVSLDTIQTCGTALHEITINDIPLIVYVPLCSTPRLGVGKATIKHPEDFILFFQAADVRADNKKIVGAFVLQGEPLSRGLSKRGYCAIIGDEVRVGVADNSPLFEQATELNGYFFRQYPLVDNGKLVENEPKNKSIRRALAEIDGKIAVVESQSLESFHDFAQALVDLGAQHAIYLVGGAALCGYTDLEGQTAVFGFQECKPFKNTNFIVWPKN